MDDSSSSFPSTRRITCVIIFAALAAGLSVYLLWYAKASGASLPGCNGQSGCHAVLGSRWATWLNIPVAALAGGCYLSIMILAYLSRKSPRPALRILLGFIALFGIGTIAWFVSLQLFEIKKICAWCMTDHALGLTTFICALLAVRLTRKQWFASGIPAVAAITAFISLHILFPPLLMNIQGEEAVTPKAGVTQTANLQLGTAEKKTSREVALFNGQLKFDVYKVPVIGDREAPYVMVELYDYTCRQCRELHPMLKDALARYGEGKVCVVMLPAPLNVECNPAVIHAVPEHRYACVYARYGLAIAAIDPDKFEAFHDWMMTGAKPPLLSDIRNKANDLVGKEAFDAAIKGQNVKDWITDGVSLFKYFDADAIPKLITDKRVANVRASTPEVLFRGLDQLTNLKPEKR